jgi:hypothetical protein
VVNTQEPKKEPRIKVWVGFILVVMALCVDGVQVLLAGLTIGVVVNSVITAVAYFAFWVIFMILGVSLIENPKKIAAMGGAGLAEIIPILNAFPAFSAGIITVILLTIAEDKGGIIGETAGMLQGKL